MRTLLSPRVVALCGIGIALACGALFVLRGGSAARATVVIPLPADLALERCRLAIERSGRFATATVDVEGAAVTARGRTRRERIRCAVRQQAGGTRVEIESRPLLPGLIGASSRGTVEEIRAGIAER